MTPIPPETPLSLTQPRFEDGAALWELVGRCPPLDRNSCYAYMLLGLHFAGTCVVARAGATAVGMVSAYRLPRSPRTLFVWQVAVDAAARGRGLAGGMLRELLARPAMADVERIETTISPGNSASIAVFRKLAGGLGADFASGPLFDPSQFAGNDHEEEFLYRIGPFTLEHAQERQ